MRNLIIAAVIALLPASLSAADPPLYNPLAPYKIGDKVKFSDGNTGEYHGNGAWTTTLLYRPDPAQVMRDRIAELEGRVESLQSEIFALRERSAQWGYRPIGPLSPLGFLAERDVITAVRAIEFGDGTRIEILKADIATREEAARKELMKLLTVPYTVIPKE